MRSSSVLRAKERCATSSKGTASMHSEEVAPVPGKVLSGLCISRKSNVPLKKPSVEVIPKIEKPLSLNQKGEPRVRSTSAPRGRNSTSSDVNAMLSDLRKQKTSTVLRDNAENRNANIEQSHGRARVLRKVNDKKLSTVRDEKGHGPSASRALKGYKDPGRITASSNKNEAVSKASKVECVEKKGKMALGVSWPMTGCKLEDNLRPNMGEKCDDVDGDALLSDGSSVKFNVSESGGPVGVQPGGYSSNKLHEKLAFLETKVKRIAFDIKRTKQMLDSNSLNTQWMMISDIQENVNEMEQEMGDLTNSNIVSMEKVSEKHQKIQKEDGVSVFTGLNNKELEAGIFSHLKLLKSRSTLKASLPLLESKAQNSKRSPFDENSITDEFLDSLRKEQYEMSKDRDGEAGSSYAQDIDCPERPEVHAAKRMPNRGTYAEAVLTTGETIDEFECQENCQPMITDDNSEVTFGHELNEIGHKTSTGGWFVSEGEAVLLAHDDSSCSFYDISNCEGKAEYKPPAGVSPNSWRDCWIIRAPGVDGCSGKYVVAASAGNTTSGFCSWDFYTRDVQAFTSTSMENKQWWYTPCGPLIVSTASFHDTVNVYDIRDGEEIMHWKVKKPVLEMDYSSPLQWRNRGEVVVADAEGITLYDVQSLTPKSSFSVPFLGQKALALHVCNTDAEVGGCVRQRISMSEAEGNNGVFCTSGFINVLDFRSRSGVGLKIPNPGISVQSIFSCGDSILLGGTSAHPGSNKQYNSLIQQLSLRKQKVVNTYTLPDSDAHVHYKGLTQVWGDSTLVMGICGLGLFVFDASVDDINARHTARETVGSNDFYLPSFDYSCSRVLLISRDRPASWRHLS